ncbi:organic cation transporter protein-like [Maniola jurtina]|uniref:organic cation transporter protein-like n=1 Tax=Maniola jurtina TaxID=191418 RepID=UPI001E68A889|nr:organic cation transporter protein-like [Maniola jurtina]
MADETSIGMDEVIKELGPFGKYNIVNYALLLFPCYLAAMQASGFNFEALDITYRCKIPECEGINETQWIDFAIPKEANGDYSKCKRYQFTDFTDNATCGIDAFDATDVQDCDGIVYSDEDSIVKDFDLGCQNWKRTLLGTIHNSGLFISLPVTGLISDKFGRKIALPIASLMNGLCGVARSFSTSYIMMAIWEFSEAALGGGAYTVAFVLAMELVPPNGRVLGNTLINFVYVIGLMNLAVLHWWLQDWRTMLRFMYIPAFPVLSYLYFLNESPRWLLSQGKHKEAVGILKKAALMNKVVLSDHTLNSLKNVECPKDIKSKSKIERDDTKKEPSIFKKVIRSPEIRKRLIVCSYMWITCTFVYYGLSINSVSLAGNRYVNFILVSFVEIPANFVCFLVLDKFGRKKVLAVTYFLSAGLCITLSFLPEGHKTWLLIVYLSGKFSITVAYSSVYIYLSELFPTNARQSLVSVCSMMGRFGSVMAPMTPLLALYYKNLPAIFFGSMALLATLLVFTLPETINLPLPDTIEEAENISRVKKKMNTA